MSNNNSKEFKATLNAYEKIGWQKSFLSDERYARLLVNKNKVLAKNETKGVKINYKLSKEKVNLKVYVKEGMKLKNPVYLCFSFLAPKGRQVINSEFFIGRGAEVKFLANCLFPQSEKVKHYMFAKVHISPQAKMSYYEEHYHSKRGGAEVYPKMEAEIDREGELYEEFKLIKGRVGFLAIDYKIRQKEKSRSHILTKVYGSGEDRIKIKERIYLDGKSASGLAKSRIVLKNRASAEILSEVEGNAAQARGHIDCQELVYGRKVKASSVPKISINHSQARVTHEAAIGKIDKKILETLMARGLSENEAVDFVLRGFLR